jgi:hypothetical protein
MSGRLITPQSKPLCFVIGPIGQERSEARKHSDFFLNALIRYVLEADEFGYKVKRADEDADPGMIGDRVITDILQAELVVADLTYLNPDVFYELGIRHSVIKPAIHVARHGTILPFDTVSQRTLFCDVSEWDSIVQCRTRLAEAARAIKTPGFRVSNPVTQANGSARLQESADPKDFLVAQMQERLATLEMKTQNHTQSQDQLPYASSFSIAIDMRSILPRGRSHSARLAKVPSSANLRQLAETIAHSLLSGGIINQEWVLQDESTGEALLRYDASSPIPRCNIGGFGPDAGILSHC